MPSRKNPTGNWASIGGGDPEVCNSCGKPYKQWPGDDCQFKIFHEPFVVTRGESQPKPVSKAPEIPRQPAIAPPKAGEPTIFEPAKELTPAQKEYVSFLKTRLAQLHKELDAAKRASGTKREEGVIQSSIDFLESKLAEIEPRQEPVKQTPSIRQIPIEKEPVFSPTYTPDTANGDYAPDVRAQLDQRRDDRTSLRDRDTLPSNPKYMGFSKSRDDPRKARKNDGTFIMAVLLILVIFGALLYSGVFSSNSSSVSSTGAVSSSQQISSSTTSMIPIVAGSSSTTASTNSVVTSTTSKSTASSSAVLSVPQSSNWLVDNPDFQGGSSKIDYAPNYDSLVNYALGLINQDRSSAGLSPVSLSSIPSGQQHADSMAYFDYFSHWDPQGYKPYMRYTLLGGMGAVAENVGESSCTNSPPSSTLLTVQSCNLSTIENGIAASEWGMMNNDVACCANGHRDNILDPLHNKVSIGIAYDSATSRLYFVEDFENSYTTLSSAVYTNNQVQIVGTYHYSTPCQTCQLFVYYDPTPQNMTVAQLDATDSYYPGTFVGGVLPSGSNEFYPNGVTVYATNWQASNGGIDITFTMTTLITAGPGVYTIYLTTSSSTGTAIITYSVFVST